MWWKVNPMIPPTETLISETEMIPQGAMDAELSIHGPFILWRNKE